MLTPSTACWVTPLTSVRCGSPAAARTAAWTGGLGECGVGLHEARRARAGGRVAPRAVRDGARPRRQLGFGRDQADLLLSAAGRLPLRGPARVEAAGATVPPARRAVERR